MLKKQQLNKTTGAVLFHEVMGAFFPANNTTIIGEAIKELRNLNMWR